MISENGWKKIIKQKQNYGSGTTKKLQVNPASPGQNPWIRRFVLAIDGIRKRLDEEAYQVRFTPRKPDSHWSHVNIKRIEELKKAKLVTKAGLAAYAKRDPENTGKASFEQEKVDLSSDFKKRLKANKEAWTFFKRNLAPSYQKQSIHWVMSAKREDTREKRLKTLIECSTKKEKIPPLKWVK